jgi:hypothetical protein
VDSPGLTVLSPSAAPFDARVTFNDQMAATKTVS